MTPKMKQQRFEITQKQTQTSAVHRRGQGT